nr:unnamed protein product [Naegleria fowleri]
MSISLPFDFDTYLGKATSNINSPSKSYSVELISYKTSIFDNVRLNNTIGTNSSRASNILSLVIGAAITSGADKSEVIVNNLNTPLVFVFPINNQTSNNFECKFINENTNAWSKEGCTTEILSTGVKCFCNHATKFSIFRLYTESVTNDEFLGNTGIRVVNVIFGCIYFVLSCGVFIGLLFLRNTNPVRSRYIGPYVGLAAIMLDSLIISFIQNIVLLAIDKGTSNTEADVVFIKTTANGFNYFNVILVIPLYLTAFFTFLVQIVRYFIKRHMYEYISNKIIYNAHVYRTITSKSAFWAILSVSLAIIVGYYVIWVGLGGANVFSNPLTFTYITSLSYFGLAWIIGMMLVIIAVWDLFYMNGHLFGSCCIPNDVNVKPTFSSSPSYVQKNRISKLMNILARTKKQKQQLGASLFLSIPQVYYFTDDNLYFRLENHLFILSYVALSINYLAGIADISVISVGIQDSASRLGPAIVGLVSGIAYSFLLIGSFGGLIVLCYLIERRRKKVTPNHQTSRVEEDELLQLLGDRFGKPLFVEFCEKEFSLENIYFYDAVSEVQRTMDSKEDDELRNLVHNMHEKFIKTGCEYEVNLPSTSTKAFNTVYGNPQATAKQIKDMLDTVLISVMYNLKDTYSRFSMTEEYRLYQQSKDNISMLENNFL